MLQKLARLFIDAVIDQHIADHIGRRDRAIEENRVTGTHYNLTAGLGLSLPARWGISMQNLRDGSTAYTEACPHTDPRMMDVFVMGAPRVGSPGVARMANAALFG